MNRVKQVKAWRKKKKYIPKLIYDAKFDAWFEEDHIDLVPLNQVFADMQDDNEIIRKAAVDYYYLHYLNLSRK